MRTIEVFADFSALTEADASSALARLESPDSLGGIAGRIYCGGRFTAAGAPPQGISRILDRGPVEACAHAMAAAADSGRPLLVLTGGIEPGCDTVGVLLGAFDDDPMIGFASAR